MKYFVIKLSLLLIIPCAGHSQNDPGHFESRSSKNQRTVELYQLGVIAEYREDYSTAIDYYNEALSLNPRNEDILMTRGQCKELDRDYVGALIDYETVVRLNPLNQNAYFKRAWIYYRQNRYELAIDDFTRLIREDGIDEGEGTTSIIFTGLEYNEGGDTQMTGVTTVDRLKSDAYNGRALAYSQIEKYAAAHDDFSRAIATNSEEPNYFVNRGLLFKKRGEEEMAIQDFKQALEIFPGHKAALYNLSLIVGEDEAATLNKDLYAEGDFAAAFSKRGYERYIINDFRGALTDYDSALQLRPGFAEDFVNRGLVHVRLGSYNKAINDYHNALRLKPEFTRAYVHLGNAHQALKQFDAAIKFYSLYLTLEGKDGTVYYNRGITAHKVGDEGMACTDLTIALNLGAKGAQKALNAICNK